MKKAVAEETVMEYLREMLGVEIIEGITVEYISMYGFNSPEYR